MWRRPWPVSVLQGRRHLRSVGLGHLNFLRVRCATYGKIISIHTKSTNTEKQLTQQYRLLISAEKEPSAKKEKNEKLLASWPV